MSVSKKLNTLLFFVFSIGSMLLFEGGNFHSPSNNNCNICHIPIGENISNNYQPVWNKNENIETYTLYKSSSLDANIGQPSGISKMCLGCHDGTTAIDDKGGSGKFSHISKGNDLSNNHPVSFTYDEILAGYDNELQNPKVAPSGLGGTIDEDLLVNGRVECISCHNPHNSMNITGMLKINNTNSKLCLTCHIK